MFKNILVPTDGSKLSQKAVKEAIQLAKITNAKITALHVYPKFSGSPYGTFGPAEDVLEEAHENQARAEADQIFNGMKKLAEPAGIAIDSVLAQGNDIVPIPGAKRRQHLEENVAAVEIKLTKEQLQRLEEALPKDAAAGKRYSDMSTVNR